MSTPKRLDRVLKLASIFVFCLVMLAGNAAAQSTIFSQPSTDVLAKGKIGIRFITKFKPNDEEAKKKFFSFTPRIIVGIGKNVEVGVNLLGNVQPGIDTTTLVPTVKWRFFANEKYKLAAVTGNNLYIPLRSKKYNAGTYTYLQMSKAFKSGTKLTAGSYFFTKNVVAKNASRGGGQFGFEQKINKTFAFASEWMTGQHSSGNLTTGFKIKFNKNFQGNVGYTIANNRAIQGNHFFYTSVGINLN